MRLSFVVVDFIKYKSNTKWIIQIPLRIHDENAIVRRGTREPDPQKMDDRKWGYLFVSLFLFAAIAFVLAFEFNLIDYLL